MKIVNYSGGCVEFRSDNWLRTLLRVTSYWSLDQGERWIVETSSCRTLKMFYDKQSALDFAMLTLATKKLKGEIE